jgi:hypothetical protein
MRRHGEVVRFRQSMDLPRFRNTANLRGTGLREAHGILGQQRFEFAHCPDVLARRDCHAALPLELRQRRKVLWRPDRLFEPEEVELSHPLRHELRLPRRPRAIRIDHQLDVVSERRRPPAHACFPNVN